MNGNPNLTIHRRRLPHWRTEGAVYFVTWRLKANQHELNESERDLIVSVVKFHHKNKYHIFAYVVMNDHVHLLLQMLDGRSLSQVVGELKAYISRVMKKEFGRSTPVWQDEFFDRIVRDESEFNQKGEYILTNPFRRWPVIKEYKWVGIM